jgi:hypothetical protein
VLQASEDHIFFFRVCRNAIAQVEAATDVREINSADRAYLGQVIRFRRVSFEPADVAECG